MTTSLITLQLMSMCHHLLDDKYNVYSNYSISTPWAMFLDKFLHFLY